MSVDFKLTRKQWATGLTLAAVVAPLVASVPLSIAVLAADSAPFWHNLVLSLVLGAMNALFWAGLPALLFGSAALALAQRTIRARRLAGACTRVLGIGAVLGAASGGVLPGILVPEVPELVLVLAPLGAITGFSVAAYCLRILRRQRAH
jgi:hypothetical protein